MSTERVTVEEEKWRICAGSFDRNDVPACESEGLAHRNRADT